MSKVIHTGIFGSDAKIAIEDACDTSSQLRTYAFDIDEYDEIIYNADATYLNDISSAVFEKSLIRRLKWYRHSIEDYNNSSHMSAIKKKLFSEKLPKIDCIIDILEKKKTPEQMNEAYPTLYPKYGPFGRLDPMKAEAIRLLNDKMSSICVKCSEEIANFTNRAFVRRDIELKSIREQIEKLRKN